MELRVKLCPVQTGNEKEFEAEVPTEVVAARLLAWSKTNAFNGGRGDSLNHIFTDLIPEAKQAVDSGKYFMSPWSNITYPNVSTSTRYGKDVWLMFNLLFDDHREWMFFYKDRYIPIPESCKIGKDGSVSVKFGEEEAQIANGDGFWPWVLLAPEVTVGILALRRFINEDPPTNPLRIVLHSQQPFKGLGLQIKDRLAKIEDMLAEGLGMLK